MKIHYTYNQIVKSYISKKDLGAVYTPTILSKWVASLLFEHIRNSSKAILDPASGDGALLLPMSQLSTNKLFATDINESALKKIGHELYDEDILNTFAIDTLNPSNDKISTLSYWKNFFNNNNIGAVISNPPWGAKVWQTKSELLNNGLELATGQFDSYDLFMELMIKAAPVNTFFAFIVPDSIFLSEHKNLRKLILNKCKIHTIARLGEGFFDNVNRGTAVLILEKNYLNKNNNVVCMRLNKEWRTNVLMEHIALDEAYDSLSHTVKQSRFKNNDELLFDIDILDSETTVHYIDSINKINWADYFKSGRGIELAKSGKVVMCNSCETVQPVPRKKEYTECKCGKTIKVSDETIKSIITDKRTKNSFPLIVGEDIKRNICSPNRYIQANVKGINYKNEQEFFENKLLIRKTGIGIKAAIDGSGSYTNQVVFHYMMKNSASAPLFMMEYVLGVLSSRVMMAYYLQKYGDNEWRSHPYITQKIIAKLPIPDIVSNKKSWNIAKKIATFVEQQRICDEKEYKVLDLEIEKLVVKIFSLSENDCKWIVNTLNGAQQLEPIRNLFIDDYRNILPE